MKTRAPLTFGSPPGQLARNQTDAVLKRMQEAHPRLTCAQVVLPIEAPTPPHEEPPFLAETPGTAALMDARLLAGEFRLAVRYAADLRSPLLAGLVRAAVLERETPFDAFLNRRGQITDDMPAGSLVGVLNLRARAQMQALWPHLEIRLLSGGVERAVEAMMRHGLVDGLVLPAIVTEHLGIQALVTELYYPEMMLPGSGQGIVVVLAREDDEDAREAARALHSQATAWELDAETAFVERVASGQDVPAGVLARVDGRRIYVIGAIASLSGASVNRASRQGAAVQAASVGASLAEQLLLSADTLLDLLEADFPEGMPTAELDEKVARRLDAPAAAEESDNFDPDADDEPSGEDDFFAEDVEDDGADDTADDTAEDGPGSGDR